MLHLKGKTWSMLLPQFFTSYMHHREKQCPASKSMLKCQHSMLKSIYLKLKAMRNMSLLTFSEGKVVCHQGYPATKTTVKVFHVQLFLKSRTA